MLRMGKNMKTMVITDIHGAAKALKQVLERSDFDLLNDTLIFTGDVVDGWPETVETIRLLEQIPNLIFVKGNHDDWAQRWLSGYLAFGFLMHPDEYRNWFEQGGEATQKSIEKHSAHEEVFNFLSSGISFYELDKKLFVHGGISIGAKAENCSYDVLIWDRYMISTVMQSPEFVVPYYDEIFIGHSPTTFLNGETMPINVSNVWAMDTGASYQGPLSIMNIDTKEIFQSDPVVDLYPGIKAR